MPFQLTEAELGFPEKGDAEFVLRFEKKLSLEKRPTLRPLEPWHLILLKVLGTTLPCWACQPLLTIFLPGMMRMTTQILHPPEISTRLWLVGAALLAIGVSYWPIVRDAATDAFDF